MRLTGLQLARARKVADAHLPDDGEVWRSAYVSDSQGGQTTTRTRIWTGPVRVAPVSSVVSSDSIIAERLGGAQGVWITLPWHVNVRLDDRIIADSATYEVASFDTGRSWHVSKRVLCREIL